MPTELVSGLGELPGVPCKALNPVYRMAGVTTQRMRVARLGGMEGIPESGSDPIAAPPPLHNV